MKPLCSLLGLSEGADNHGVIALIWLQCDLLLGSQLHLLQLLHLTGEYGLWGGCGVNARRLDGDHEVASVLQKVLCVEANNTRLQKDNAW